MTSTYRAAGMTCDHCKSAVTDEVSKVDGADVEGAAVVAAIVEAGCDAVAG